MAGNGGHLTIDRLTVDGLGEDLTGLYLYNNTYHPGAGVKKLTASDCTFENLCAQQASQYGAGIGMNTPGTANNLRSDIEISGCTFREQPDEYGNRDVCRSALYGRRYKVCRQGQYI